jgi:hypothetical protein
VGFGPDPVSTAGSGKESAAGLPFVSRKAAIEWSGEVDAHDGAAEGGVGERRLDHRGLLPRARTPTHVPETPVRNKIPSRATPPTARLVRMHRSRVSTFLIDVRRDDVDEATGFWAEALGVRTSSPDGEPQFVTLNDGLPGYVLAIQSVNDGPRYHLDIETEDVDAEIERLLKLGAVEVSSWQGCRTLRAPGRPPALRHSGPQRPGGVHGTSDRLGE